MPVQISSSLRKALKVVVTLAICAYLIWLIQSKSSEFRELITRCSQGDHVMLLYLALGLIFVNWSFETLKWKTLVKPVEKLTFFNAYEGVLVGLSMGLITPRSIGDYIGRLMLIESDQKHTLLGSLLLSRVSQMVATLIFGLLGILGFVSRFGQKLPHQSTAAVVVLGLIILLFSFRREILTFIFRTSLGARMKKYLVIIRNYSISDVFSVLGFSIARYIVFSIQYYLLLIVLGVEMNTIDLFILISIVFLVKSMMFSVNFLTDMGVRQLTAVGIMSLVNIPDSIAVLGSFGIWGVNILIPSFVGLVLLVRVKWRLE